MNKAFIHYKIMYIFLDYWLMNEYVILYKYFTVSTSCHYQNNFLCTFTGSKDKEVQMINIITIALIQYPGMLSSFMSIQDNRSIIIYCFMPLLSSIHILSLFGCVCACLAWSSCVNEWWSWGRNMTRSTTWLALKENPASTGEAW